MKKFSDIIFKLNNVDLFLSVDNWRFIDKFLKSWGFFGLFHVKLLPSLAISAFLLLGCYVLFRVVSLSFEMWSVFFVFEKLMEFSFYCLSQRLDKLFTFLLNVNATVVDGLIINCLIVSFKLIEERMVPFFKDREAVLVELIFFHEVGVHFE